MKYFTHVIVGAVLFFTGAVFAGAAINEAAPHAMFKEFASPFEHAKTVEVIKRRIDKQPGWSVVSVIDQAETIRKGGGGNVGKYTIIKFCSPKFAGRMLADDARRFYGVAMPLSIAVYTLESGKVMVSLMNGALISMMFGGELEAIANDVRLEVEEMFSFFHVDFDVFRL